MVSLILPEQQKTGEADDRLARSLFRSLLVLAVPVAGPAVLVVASLVRGPTSAGIVSTMARRVLATAIPNPLSKG